MRKQLLLNKLLSSVASLALLFNSFFYPLSIAYAQEETPTPEPTPAVTEQPTLTPAPTEEPVLSPSPVATVEPEVSPTPVETVEPEITPAPTEIPTIETTATPNEIPAPPSTDQSTPAPEVQARSTTNPETPVPTTTPVQPENGKIEAVILPNTQAASISEFDLTVQTDGSATLQTDKLDYAPTDSVLVTGSGFIAGKTYTIVISSSDTPAITFTDSVTANSEGKIIYSYQLDGIYRPNYQVEVKDGERVVASTTFTDTETTSASLAPTGSFSDNFGSGPGDTNNVPNWYDKDGNGSDTKVVGSGGNTGAYAFVHHDDWICRTLNATEYNSLQLQYYWKGDSNAENTDFGRVQYKVGGNCSDNSGWTTIVSNDLSTNASSWTLQSVSSLDAALNNATFHLRFYADSNHSDEDFRVDDVSVSGSLIAPTPTPTPTLTPTPSPTPTLTPTPSPTPSPSGGLLCTDDVAGANDEPGQKDLTRMCVNYDNLPANLFVSWNWDETGWSGNNSGDGCSLYDTDGDGLANYSLCAIVKNDPATYDSKVLYSCGDGSAFKCTNPIVVLTTSPSTNCNAAVVGEDPFPAGQDYPNDTKATCTIDMNDVGGGTAILIDVCSYPSQQPNSDPSDCIIYRPRAGKLEIKKVVNPISDPGLFNLLIEGEVKASDVSNGGTTGEVSLSEGTHTFSETAGMGTDLNDYSQSVECRDTNGTGNVVSVTGSGAGPYTIDIPDQADIVCLITNSQKLGTLIIQKVMINDNGGAKVAPDFSFSVNGASAVAFEADGQNDLTVNAGSYTITEPPVTGYMTTYENCTGINVPAGGSATCTITNDDIQPQFQLIKEVIGGTAGVTDFDLFINDIEVVSGETNGFDAGSYTISETGPDGYTAAFNGDCDENGNFSLVVGDPVRTCTITNIRETGNLQAQKVVDFGSVTDWWFSLDGGASIQADASGLVDFGQVTTLDNHTIIESGPLGTFYLDSISGANCTPNILNNSATAAVTKGGTTVCIFSNLVNRGSITIIKDAIPDDSQDFSFVATGSGVVNFDLDDDGDNGNGLSNSRTFPNLLPGNYSFTEGAVTGWDPSLVSCDSTDGNDTLGVGAVAINVSAGENDVTCTFTNTKRGSVTIVKDTVGGDDSFHFDSGTLPVPGFNITTVSNTGSQSFNDLIPGTYDVYETVPAGWELTDLDCTDSDGGSSVDLAQGLSTIDLDPEQSITCTYTNSKLPKLTVIKVVENDDGGTKLVSDFPLFVDGDSVTSGATNTYQPDNYLVTETSDTAYTATFGGGCDKDGNVSLAYGDNKICTITNDDIAPTLKLVKSVTTDNGGTAVSGDWTLTARRLCVAGDPDPSCGFSDAGDSTAFHTLRAGRVYNLSESGPSGYSMGSWSCDGGSLNGNKLTLSLDDEVTCTITNDDIVGSIRIIKNTLGGDDTFDFTVNGPTVGYPSIQTSGGTGDSGLLYVNAGGYSIGETPLAGWDLTDSFCDSGTPGSFTVALDTTVTCTFENTKRGSITGMKWNDLDGDGILDAGEPGVGSTNGNQNPRLKIGYQDASGNWIWNYDGYFYPNGTYEPYLVSPGTYWAFEYNLPSGWSQTFPDQNAPLSPWGDRLNGPIVVTPGANVQNINFGNFEYGQIRACKFEDLDGDGDLQDQDSILAGVTINLFKEGEGWQPVASGQTEMDGCISFTGLEYGNYRVGEEVPAGYYQTYPVNPEYYDNIGVASGYDNSEEPFIFLNTRLASLGDFVWNDTNGDGIQDLGETGITNVDIKLYKDDGDGIFNDALDAYLGTEATDGTGGYYKFRDLEAGKYWVVIDQTTMPAGFMLTTVSVFGVELTPGANYLDADFGLIPIVSEIKIEKSNDSASTSAGSTVTYTLTLTNTGNVALDNISITDVLPGGFSYIAGSTTGATTNDPTISGGVMTWAGLGPLAPAAVLTLSYKAAISSDLVDGSYKNLATCFGWALREEKVDCNVADSTVSLGHGISYGGSLAPQVLGAATELPATGSATWILLLAGALGILGAGLKIYGRKYAKR